MLEELKRYAIDAFHHMRVIIDPELPSSYLCDWLSPRYKVRAVFSDQQVDTVEKIVVYVVDYALSAEVPVPTSASSAVAGLDWHSRSVVIDRNGAKARLRPS